VKPWLQGKRLISSRSKDLLEALERKLLQELSLIKPSGRPRVAIPKLAGLQEQGKGAQGKGARHASTAPNDNQDQAGSHPGAPSTAGASRRSLPLDKIDTWQLIDAYKNFNAQQKERMDRAKHVRTVTLGSLCQAT
jgi:hypothetical protein